jgi:hypothetical protein
MTVTRPGLVAPIRAAGRRLPAHPALGGRGGLGSPAAAPQHLAGKPGPLPNACTLATGMKLAPPASGSYTGVWNGGPKQPWQAPAATIASEVTAQISAWQRTTGVHPDTYYFDTYWGQLNGSATQIEPRTLLRFPAAAVRAAWNDGTVPFIRINPAAYVASQGDLAQ